MQTVKLGMEESYCGIVALYNKVATLLGHENTDDLHYDCRKINVANNIFENIRAYYEKDQKLDKESFGMAWVCYGPKCDEALPDDTITIEDGFAEVV